MSTNKKLIIEKDEENIVPEQTENVEAAPECEQPEGEQPAEQTECEHLEQETEQVENTEPATGM